MDMKTREAKRTETAAALQAMGCEVVAATFDRRSGSYAIGFADGSGYFTPTWNSVAKALDWAGGNLTGIERYAKRGEGVTAEEFILERVAEAAGVAGDDPAALREALRPRWDEIRAEVERLDDEYAGVGEDVLDDIEAGSVAPSEAVSRLADAFYMPNPLDTPSPR